MTVEKRRRFVHIVSHGPHCLDGVAAAVAIARARPNAIVMPRFVNNVRVNEALVELQCEPPGEAHEVWVTDVSWSDRAVDRHLRHLVECGVHVYWIDHHRTAIERFEAGAVDVPFTERVVTERYAASRLTYEYLHQQFQARSTVPPQAFLDFWPIVELADDNDRWLHRVPGSRDLALTLQALGTLDAYYDLLNLGPDLAYTPRMAAARQRVEEALLRTFAVAERSRVVRPLLSGLTLVAAMCDGYASEIADAWGKELRNAVFALFDAKSLGVSLRRSPDCTVDLSRLARTFGGGGHAAAAGCELPQLRRNVAQELASLIGEVLEAKAE